MMMNLTSDRFARYEVPKDFLKPSNRHLAHLERAQKLAFEHDSGGSFHMVAMLCRSKPMSEVGKNWLHENPAVKIDTYPERCGRHAELDLWCRSDDMNNGTVVVAGRTRGRNVLDSTVPCVYCAAILVASGVRWVVCMLGGEPVKIRTTSLVPNLNGR